MRDTLGLVAPHQATAPLEATSSLPRAHDSSISPRLTSTSHSTKRLDLVMIRSLLGAGLASFLPWKFEDEVLRGQWLGNLF